MSEYREYIFFGTLVIGFLILFFLARRQELPPGLIDEEEHTAAWKKPFGKAAVLLWKRFQCHSKRWRKGSGQENISRKDLVILQKVQSMLVFGMLACILGFFLTLVSDTESLIGDDGSITRNSYHGTRKDVKVVVETVDPSVAEEGVTSQDISASGNEKGNTDNGQDNLGEIVIQVDPRKYTHEETDVLAQEVFTKLPGVMAGDNADLMHVNQPLNLVGEMEDYPFSISWVSADYDVVDTNGTVMTIYEETGQEAGNDETNTVNDGEIVHTTTLTAKLYYNGWHYEQSYPVVIIPVQETVQQRMLRRIQEELAFTQLEQESSAKLQLPTTVDGERIIWKEQKEDSARWIFIIVIVAGVVNCFLIDRKLGEQKENRRRELRLEYPQLISKFVLFLGAGMSVRNVFFKLGEDYVKDRETGAEKKEAYEEILLSCRELESGVSEAVVYGHFGQRCEVRQYNRLATLLVQDLRKGNNELLQVLQEEAQGAIQERRQMARTLGEEAGTKLLMPMVMMLAVTMVIIVIPAFMGFSV